MKTRREGGFTLPELVVVGAVIGLMSILALVFAHPRDYSPQTRNADRWVGISRLMVTIERYYLARGALPDGITDAGQAIGSLNGMLNLCPALVPAYTKDLVYDPLIGGLDSGTSCMQPKAQYSTGFVISRTKDNTVTLLAPAAEGGETISLSKRF